MPVINSILDTCLERQTQKAVCETQKILGKSVMKLSYSHLEQPRMKDFIQRASGENLFFDILNNLFSLLSSVITLVGLSAIIVTLQPVILLLIIAVVAVRLLTEKYNRKIFEKYRLVFAKIMRRVGYVINLCENAEYGKEIRVNNLQKWVFDKYNRVAKDEHLFQSKSQVKDLAKTESFVGIAVIVQECIVYLILVYKVVFSGMLIGDFSMYLTGIGNFSSCLQSIISSFSGIRKSGDFAADFRYCVEMADTMENTEIISVKTDSLCSIEFEFRNVSFKYPNTDRMILKNISLKIKAGESLSLVGVNGAGKTTLVKLLCRLYEPTDGEIFMNGVPIQEFPYDTYRPLIGVVFQDFKTFAFSVAENVALQTSYDEKRVTECMAKSDILDKG